MRRLFLLQVALLTACSGVGDSARALRQGDSFERELKPAEEHVYSVPLGAGESAVVSQAGTVAAPGIRSDVADPNTVVVNKGAVTKDIIAAPESQSPEATASTPK